MEIRFSPERKNQKRQFHLLESLNSHRYRCHMWTLRSLKSARRQFSKDEWMDIMLRSIGMEPDTLTCREKWLLLIRMIPLVENNFNLCELGPRSTGKSHLFKEISPNSILVSGGQTTVQSKCGCVAKDFQLI